MLSVRREIFDFRMRIIVCLDVLNFLAVSDTDFPEIRSIMTDCCWLALSEKGRPNFFPSAFARLRPDCVLSIIKSLSNSATALRIVIVIFPDELVKSVLPNARQ